MKRDVLRIALSFIVSVLSCSVVQGNLLLHWAFDDAVGAATAADTSPAGGYPGTVNAAVTFGEGGIAGTAAYFDGASYVDSAGATVSGNTDFRGSNFTISYWLKSDNAGTSYPISLTYYVAGAEAGWLFLYRSTPNMTYRLYQGASVVDEFQASISSTQWAHVVMTSQWDANVTGEAYRYLVTRKCYLNGVLLDTEIGVPYEPLPDVTNGTFAAGARQGETSPRPFKGWLDDVQYYDQTLDAGAVTYLYEHPGATVDWATGFIPDDFEAYADNTALATLWSTTSGTLSLETTEVNDGVQSLRVQITVAGTVTKTMPYVPDFSDQDGLDIILWYKGIMGNPAGDLTVRVKNSGGAVAVQKTVTDATQAADWTELRLERYIGDPADLTILELDISSAATMYFDSISFQPPQCTAPEAILEWRLDETSGLQTGDATAYGNHGALGSWFTGGEWAINGGHSDDTGDNALSFAGAGNDTNAEVLSGSLSPDVSNFNSYSINLWMKLNSTAANTKIILGGVGDVWSNPGATANLLPRYIVIDGDTLEPELLRGWDGAAWIYSGFATTINLNAWHMLTVVCNGWADTIDLYVDGVLTRTMHLADCGLIDASVAALSPDVFDEIQFTAPDGVIDDFTVWKGILPAQGDAPSVLSLWGSWICTAPVEIDYNDDCVTDEGDLAYFASRWLDSGRLPINVVPRPMRMNIKADDIAFTLMKDIPVVFDEDGRSTGEYLIDILSPLVFEASESSPSPPAIYLNFSTNLFNRLGQEGYLLDISPDRMTISAADNAGFFYGVQTLRQLLGPKFEKQPRDPNAAWKLPCLFIEDKPRFPWRAYMLDEARFFQGKDTVESLLDEMAYLKMNILHWHLTDDQGWRIEIENYPLLTEIGSWRSDSQKADGSFYGEPHSGFYTQQDIQEIVSYAAERHITIVPEIDMPGHSTAAIASYQWLGSTGEPRDVCIYFTRAVEYKDVLNVTNPAVIQFCEDVLDEIMAMFPGPVIHIGGDEVFYEIWAQNPDILAYMQQENIGSYAELQLQFTNAMSHYLEAHGKRMMGWNDILGQVATDQIAPNTVVHFWKGDISLITQAAEHDYDIVNSYYPYTYLDYSYSSIPLTKAYSFEPIPSGLDSRFHGRVKGLGCQMWTEYFINAEQVYRQTFPRLAAYAEVGWTTAKNKDFTDFHHRLVLIQQHWDLNGINYYPQ
ncbi:MAG: family 20 glycosylhydrolase [Sedimentisphaerales bacterium]|nr:family 20 glycosylhydrolase [Sedimentisphaerales bacterium]